MKSFSFLAEKNLPFGIFLLPQANGVDYLMQNPINAIPSTSNHSAHEETGDAKAPGEQALLKGDAGIPESIGHMAVIGFWIGH